MSIILGAHQMQLDEGSRLPVSEVDTLKRWKILLLSNFEL